MSERVRKFRRTENKYYTSSAEREWDAGARYIEGWECEACDGLIGDTIADGWKELKVCPYCGIVPLNTRTVAIRLELIEPKKEKGKLSLKETSGLSLVDKVKGALSIT